MCLVFGLASQAYRTAMLTVPPETVSSPKRKKKRTTTARARATAKRKQQQNAKHKTKCKCFLCLFLLSRFSFFMCIYGKMQIATCNNKQHVQADATCGVCATCVCCIDVAPLPFCLLRVTSLPRGFCRCCCCLHGNLSSQRIAFNCNFATLQLQPLQRRCIPLQVTFQVQCLLDNNERNYAKRLVMRRMSSVVHTKCVCLWCHTHTLHATQSQSAMHPQQLRERAWERQRADDGVIGCSAGQAAPTNQIKEIQRTQTDNGHTRATTANKTKQQQREQQQQQQWVSITITGEYTI